MEALVIPFEKLRVNDVDKVGGKNSSLGEMISQLADTGVRVPGGFATTAQAYRVSCRSPASTTRSMPYSMRSTSMTSMNWPSAAPRFVNGFSIRRSRWT
jgi:hypothetical protein